MRRATLTVFALTLAAGLEAAGSTCAARRRCRP